MFAATAGKYAALTAITTQGFFLHGRLPMPDMLMTLFITASLWMLWRMAEGAPRAWLGFYAFVGLAFWAKGPGGFLPLIVAVARAGGGPGARPRRAVELPPGVPPFPAVGAPRPPLPLRPPAGRPPPAGGPKPP